MHFASSVPVFAAAFCATLVVACGGQEFVAGGVDASSSIDGSVEASTCVTLPTTTGDEGDFCALEAKLFTGCSQCAACRQTDLDNCVALGDSLSIAFKGALDACESQIPCGDYSTYGSDPCVAANLTKSTKSTAQIAAATTYCSKCGTTTTVTSCVNGFFQPPQPDGGAAGVGYLVLLSSDAIAESIATNCSGTAACPAADVYELCAVAEFCKTQQPDACNKTGYCSK